ncbi:fasciclin domain-containing protein, partial [Rhodopseudomonas sp. BR0C11]
VMLIDAKGGSSTVTIPNVNQSNGVIHVIDTVLLPS